MRNVSQVILKSDLQLIIGHVTSRLQIKSSSNMNYSYARYVFFCNACYFQRKHFIAPQLLILPKPEIFYLIQTQQKT